MCSQIIEKFITIKPICEASNQFVNPHPPIIFLGKKTHIFIVCLGCVLGMYNV